MKFNHLFYDSEINFKSISRTKIVLSILLGLVSAIVIYCFFYVVRETDRMMSLDFENRPLTLTDARRNLYNLFFAAISMVLGNSIAISFLVSRPQNIFSRRNNKRNRIINDQSFLGPNFIYWFTQIWFLFGAFASEIVGSKFLDFYLLPSILIIVVLYLDSWKTLILVIKKNRWKIQLIHLMFFVIATFILSRVDVVDYKSIDDSILIKNPSVDVPSSLYQNDNHRNNYYDNLVFKMNFVSETEVGLFNSENEQIELYEIYSYIHKWMEYAPEEQQSRMSSRLRANRNVPIKYIKQFELKVLTSGQSDIIYEIANEDELTSRFYNSKLKHGISLSLQDKLPLLPGETPRVPFLEHYYKGLKFQDTLRLSISNKIEIKNLEVPLNMLPRTLKNYINNSTVIEYIYDDSTTYQDYINVLSAHKTAVWEMRVIENYDVIDSTIQRNLFSRDEKLRNERFRIQKKYPINITERFE
tara:strand:- start:62 stop:1474 length:1413 start_codon:yes stop_codon:yes gene_type:complete